MIGIKDKTLCRTAEMFLLRCLPFVLVAAVYTLLYILRTDEYTLYAARRGILELIEYVCLSLTVSICGSLFADMNIKRAEME